MYNYSKIKNMHLEPSSLCNAECPVCNRRIRGGPKNPFMTERCITLDEFKQWFSVDFDDGIHYGSFIGNLDQLILCGNYGDPMTTPELVPILQYVRELNPTISISMNTNAGGRDSQFWKDMAKIIGRNGRMVFSVDGLEDTNHIYRKGVNWDKVMNAMLSYNSVPDSTSVWEFLVFEHNQHQITEARELAKEIGIDKFYAKKAMGFESVADDNIKKEIQVLDHDGKLDYKIYSPDDEWKNEALLKKDTEQPSVTKKGDVEDLIKYFEQNKPLKDYYNNLNKKSIKKLDDCKISCDSLSWYNLSRPELEDDKWQGIFVDSTGLVLPCCFTGSKYYANASFESIQLREFVHSYGEDTIRLSKDNNIKNIIHSDIMQKGFVKRWNTPTTKEGKLFTCSTFCGKGVNDEIESTKRSITEKPSVS